MAKSKTEIELEKKAFDFRRSNGLSSTEPIRLKSLLLQLNVLTLFRPLSGDFSGMALKADDHRFIMVNTTQSIGKQHFTLAHELYHLFIQENFTSQTCSTGKFDKRHPEEYKADWFAAFLLLPEDGICHLIPSDELKRGTDISLQTILKIENIYSVSRHALLVRFKKLGLIDDRLFDQYKTGVIKGATQNGYAPALYTPGNENEVIGDYGAMAQRLLQAEKISESHYLELMHAIGINPLQQPAGDENDEG